MEAASPDWRVGIDTEAASVDHDVVMEPTERREVGVVVGAATSALLDVVRLQAIRRAAAVDGAPAVP